MLRIWIFTVFFAIAVYFGIAHGLPYAFSRIAFAQIDSDQNEEISTQARENAKSPFQIVGAIGAGIVLLQPLRAQLRSRQGGSE